MFARRLLTQLVGLALAVPRLSIILGLDVHEIVSVLISLAGYPK
jgi:hypothetical protein